MFVCTRRYDLADDRFEWCCVGSRATEIRTFVLLRAQGGCRNHGRTADPTGSCESGYTGLECGVLNRVHEELEGVVLVCLSASVRKVTTCSKCLPRGREDERNSLNPGLQASMSFNGGQRVVEVNRQEQDKMRP